MSKKRSRSKQSAAPADDQRGDAAGRTKKRDDKRQKAPPWEVDEYARSLETLGDYRQAVRNPTFRLSLFRGGQTVYETIMVALVDIKHLWYFAQPGMLDEPVLVCDCRTRDEMLCCIRLMEFTCRYAGKSLYDVLPGWPKYPDEREVFDTGGRSHLDAAFDFVWDTGKGIILILQEVWPKEKRIIYRSPFKFLEETPAVDGLQVSYPPDPTVKAWFDLTVTRVHNRMKKYGHLEAKFSAYAKYLADEREEWERALAGGFGPESHAAPTGGGTETQAKAAGGNDHNPLVRTGRRIVQCCPTWDGSDDGTWLTEGLSWCRRAARWTRDTLPDESHGPAIRTPMRRPLRVFEAGTAERNAYDACVKRLVSGYDRFAEQAPPTMQKRVRTKSKMKLVPTKRTACGPILREEDPIGPLPYRDFAERAKAMIQGELTHPFRRFAKSLTDGGRLPMLEAVRTSLDAAFRALVGHLAKADLPIDEAEWSGTFDRLTDLLEDEANYRAAPWTWLGLNMLGYLDASTDHVFPFLTSKDRAQVKVVLQSGNVGPTPAYVTAIRDALNTALDDLSAPQPETPEEVAEAAGVKRKRPRVKEATKLAIQDHPSLKHRPAQLVPYVLTNMQTLSPGYKPGRHFASQVRKCVRKILGRTQEK